MSSSLGKHVKSAHSTRPTKPTVGNKKVSASGSGKSTNNIQRSGQKGKSNTSTTTTSFRGNMIADKHSVSHQTALINEGNSALNAECIHCQGKSEDMSFSEVEKMSEARVQKPAPVFSGKAVKQGEFIDVKLSDYTGKYVVLFFYPLDFTFVCPTEIIAFSDRVEEFKSINCEVVACSVDSEFSHLAWTNVPRKKGGLGQMNIPLLSDITKDISKRYGVLLEDQGVALRGLFIIDGKGILRQMTINDLPVGRSVDETLRLVQAFQFTDKHGEVCPAGWKPGAATMKPDPKGSQKYFSDQ